MSLLGFGACKTQKQRVECVYGPPPVDVVEIERVDTVIVQRQEMKVVYGPPVVKPQDDDWRNVRPDEEGVYDIAEVMPRFPGGEKAMKRWVAENIQYPDEARNAGVSGRVIVSFTVMTSGKLDGVTVLKPVHPLLDAEAVRLVRSMPWWEPGRQRGETVPVRYFIPVEFR